MEELQALQQSSFQTAPAEGLRLEYIEFEQKYQREMDRPMKNVAVGRKTPGGAGKAD